MRKDVINAFHSLSCSKQKHLSELIIGLAEQEACFRAEMTRKVILFENVKDKVRRNDKKRN